MYSMYDMRLMIINVQATFLKLAGPQLVQVITIGNAYENSWNSLYSNVMKTNIQEIFF